MESPGFWNEKCWINSSSNPTEKINTVDDSNKASHYLKRGRDRRLTRPSWVLAHCQSHANVSRLHGNNWEENGVGGGRENTWRNNQLKSFNFNDDRQSDGRAKRERIPRCWKPTVKKISKAGGGETHRGAARPRQQISCKKGPEAEDNCGNFLWSLW